MGSTVAPKCDYLILDAGPLLSLSPLRGLAKIYLTVPQVLDELKDRRAREHFEQLGLSAGVKVEVRAPDAASLAKVAQAAKKTGDYSVLSHADLCVLALTYSLEQTEAEKVSETASLTAGSTSVVETADIEPQSDADDLASQLAAVSIEPSQIEDTTNLTQGPVQPIVDSQDTSIEETPEALLPSPALGENEEPQTAVSRDAPSPDPIFDDPSDDDDGEGEWITPANVDLHKSRALDLLPDPGKNAKSKAVKHMNVACMTADFAMQNVMLHMGLNLVGVEGKRIDTVKTWVLRCHACFKICQDSTRKFCPSCGNPTLLRASVTVSAPRTPGGQATMQVHLKKNFQHRLRGTIYSIPAPKPGSAKTGTGEGLILREDQSAYARAAQKDASKRQREERKMMSNALERGAKGQQGGVVIGSWMDPDWVPEIMSVGAGGHGRNRGKGDMPTIGYGRKNPNERRRKK